MKPRRLITAPRGRGRASYQLEAAARKGASLGFRPMSAFAVDDCFGKGPASAEREAESLGARIKKLDFNLAIGDWSALPDQLVQPLLAERAVALFVNIEPVGCAWRLSVDQHAEFHRCLGRRRAHHEIEVARMEAVCDAAVGLVQFDG